MWFIEGCGDKICEEGKLDGLDNADKYIKKCADYCCSNL